MASNAPQSYQKYGRRSIPTLVDETAASKPDHVYTSIPPKAARYPFIVVHTLGSTGLPKVVILCHGGVATVDSQPLMSSLDELDPVTKLPRDSYPRPLNLAPFSWKAIVLAAALGTSPDAVQLDPRRLQCSKKWHKQYLSWDGKASKCHRLVEVSLLLAWTCYK